MAKWLSRKLVMTVLFGVGVPVLFQTLGISEMVTLCSMGIGGAYLGANVLSKPKADPNEP
jgi:hypothetical protein